MTIESMFWFKGNPFSSLAIRKMILFTSRCNCELWAQEVKAFKETKTLYKMALSSHSTLKCLEIRLRTINNQGLMQSSKISEAFPQGLSSPYSPK